MEHIVSLDSELSGSGCDGAVWVHELQYAVEFIGYSFSVGYIRGYIREYNRLFFTR